MPKKKVQKKDNVIKPKSKVPKNAPAMYLISIGPDLLDLAMASLKGKKVEFTLETLPPMVHRRFVAKGTIKKTEQDGNIIVIEGFMNLDSLWPAYRGRYNVEKRIGTIVVG